jgi:hypothetical protein
MSDLVEHLNANTTSSNKWNNWPDKLEIVKTEFLELTYDDGYTLGYTIGRAKEFRQVSYDKLPRLDVSVHLPYEYRLVNVRFAWAHGPGQESGGTPNVLAVFDREQKYDFDTRKMVATWGGMIVEIGCNHDLHGRKLGNCYSETKCARCGWWYRVDSSG